MQRNIPGTTPTSDAASSARVENDHDDKVRCRVNNSNNNEIKEGRTNRQHPRQQKTAVSGSGSVVWIILSVGLILCVTDVVYMMGVLERTGKHGVRKKHHHHKKHSKKEEEKRRKAAEALADQEDLSNYINSTEISDKKTHSKVGSRSRNHLRR